MAHFSLLKSFHFKFGMLGGRIATQRNAATAGRTYFWLQDIQYVNDEIMIMVFIEISLVEVSFVG